MEKKEKLLKKILSGHAEGSKAKGYQIKQLRNIFTNYKFNILKDDNE